MKKLLIAIAIVMGLLLAGCTKSTSQGGAESSAPTGTNVGGATNMAPGTSTNTATNQMPGSSSQTSTNMK